MEADSYQSSQLYTRFYASRRESARVPESSSSRRAPRARAYSIRVYILSRIARSRSKREYTARFFPRSCMRCGTCLLKCQLKRMWDCWPLASFQNNTDLPRTGAVRQTRSLGYREPRAVEQRTANPDRNGITKSPRSLLRPDVTRFTVPRDIDLTMEARP